MEVSLLVLQHIRLLPPPPLFTSLLNFRTVFCFSRDKELRRPIDSGTTKPRPWSPSTCYFRRRTRGESGWDQDRVEPWVWPKEDPGKKPKRTVGETTVSFLVPVYILSLFLFNLLINEWFVRHFDVSYTLGFSLRVKVCGDGGGHWVRSCSSQTYLSWGVVEGEGGVWRDSLDGSHPFSILPDRPVGAPRTVGVNWDVFVKGEQTWILFGP